MTRPAEEMLQEEFRPIAERLTADYVATVRRAFDRFSKLDGNVRAVIAMGRTPEGMSHTDANRENHFYRVCRGYIRYEGGRINADVSLTEDYLARKAAEYGEEQANAFTAKLARKIDGVDNVEMTWSAPHGVNFSLKAEAGENQVAVTQQSVVKYSSKGNFYHQFPALLYLNGKFTPEKKLREVLDPRVKARDMEGPGL